MDQTVVQDAKEVSNFKDCQDNSSVNVFVVMQMEKVADFKYIHILMSSFISFFLSYYFAKK